MPHILEWIKPESTFTAGDIIEEKITDILVRMRDFYVLSATESQESVIEGWRDELMFIREAVHGVFNSQLFTQVIRWPEKEGESDDQA
jgi:hypothetical protein